MKRRAPSASARILPRDRNFLALDVNDDMAPIRHSTYEPELPACTLLTGAGFDYVVLPHGCDEIGVAGAVQGASIRMVKARTGR